MDGTTVIQIVEDGIWTYTSDSGDMGQDLSVDDCEDHNVDFQEILEGKVWPFDLYVGHSQI